jgi:hypothetical protein
MHSVMYSVLDQAAPFRVRGSERIDALYQLGGEM